MVRRDPNDTDHAHAGALFSQDRYYRYLLWRIWDESKPLVAFVLLNPSTADERLDDPTIRRCIGFAKVWGYGGLFIANIFALRSTDPEALYGVPYADAVGPENDETLWQLNDDFGNKDNIQEIILGWGNHGDLGSRGVTVAKMFPAAKCLGITSRYQPRHPLYTRADTPLLLYSEARRP